MIRKDLEYGMNGVDIHFVVFDGVRETCTMRSVLSYTRESGTLIHYREEELLRGVTVDFFFLEIVG